MNECRCHLLCALVSALLPVTGLSAWALPNLVENPGLEESDDMGDPARWGWWGSHAGEAADDEFFEHEPEGHSGGWSVSIREEGWGRRGWWYTIVRGVKPQSWYCVSVWAKRDRPTGWVPELHIFGQRRVMNLYRPDVWQKFDWLLNSNEFEGDPVLKLVNCRKPFKVWFDDVVVEEFVVEPDDQAEPGTLRWHCPPTSELVVFEVQAAISGSFDRSWVLGKTLNTEMALPSGVPRPALYWRVKAFQNDDLLAMSQPRLVSAGQLSREAQDAALKAEGASSAGVPGPAACLCFDELLNLIVVGRPFFPVGIYGLRPEKFAEAKRAGFNTVLTNEVDAARRAGLRPIVNRGFRYEEEAADRMSPWEANRWIIARYLWDEPDQNNASPRAVFQAHLKEKKADPYHPTAIVVYRPENFRSYASTSDILMTDPYPVPHRPLSTVSECVRAARRAVRDHKPVWAVIQAFNWMDSSQEARRLGWARWPTYDEQRCMAYLAVINGARGILFHRYCGEADHDPTNWRALKRVAGELRGISPILMGRTLSMPVAVAAHPLHGPDRGDEAKRIEFVLKTDDRRTYLIAANNWPGERQVTFSFDENLSRLVMVPFEKRRIRAQEKSFSDLFAPYGVHIYELRLR